MWQTIIQNNKKNFLKEKILTTDDLVEKTLLGRDGRKIKFWPAISLTDLYRRDDKSRCYDRKDEQQTR